MKPLAQMRAAPLTRHNSSGDSNVAMIDILGREFLSYGGSSVRSTMVGQKRYNTPIVSGASRLRSFCKLETVDINHCKLSPIRNPIWANRSCKKNVEKSKICNGWAAPQLQWLRSRRSEIKRLGSNVQPHYPPLAGPCYP